MNPNAPNPYGPTDASFGHASEVGHAHGGPYYSQQPGAAVPDLDAGAPVLRSSEVQRLNRKALVFLGAIVVLLVVAAMWMFRSAAAGEEGKPKAITQEVNIPEVPRGMTEESLAVQEELPPLPMDIAALPPPVPMQEQMSGPFADAPPSPPREPSLMERRMGNLAGGETSLQAALGGVPGMVPPDTYAQAMLNLASQGGERQAAAKPARAMPTSAQPIASPDTLLVRGTFIRCVLETRIITDVAGFASCIVTEPVYSINGRRLLLPKGSKISGTYGNDNINGPRVAVVWDRITTPAGIDINMASPGVDNLGGAGHPGDYDAHWAGRIGSALLISLISDAFKYAGAKHGPQTTTITNAGNEVIQPYESSTARAMERLTNQAVDRSMNRAPTVTINHGSVVNVYVAKDVDFSTVLP